MLKHYHIAALIWDEFTEREGLIDYDEEEYNFWMDVITESKYYNGFVKATELL
jgi:hypothetical protein